MIPFAPREEDSVTRGPIPREPCGNYDPDEMLAQTKLGRYSIIHKAGVGPEAEIDKLVAIIMAGQEVAVLEVLYDEYSNRIRARIGRPAGWVSLVDTVTGFDG